MFNLFLKKFQKKIRLFSPLAEKKKYARKTISFLKKNKLYFNEIIFDLPYGERILVNDIKPKNKLKTAISINVKRNSGLEKYKI